jgi:hypothetical protein
VLSSPQRWFLDFARVLDRLAPLLEEHDFPSAVIDGLGLHAYGHSRATLAVRAYFEKADMLDWYERLVERL